MTLFDAIRNLFSGGEKSGKAYIVDASRLEETRKNKRLAPREQINILKKLSQLAAREELYIEALFEGNPLRVAGDGQLFDSVRVFYTGKKMNRAQLVERRVGKNARRRDVILITPDRELEDIAMKLGGQPMSPGTFRRMLDESGGASSRGDKGDHRQRSRKPRRRKRDGGGRGDRKAAQGNNGGNGGEKDRIRELVDLVE